MDQSHNGVVIQGLSWIRVTTAWSCRVCLRRHQQRIEMFSLSVTRAFEHVRIKYDLHPSLSFVVKFVDLILVSFSLERQGVDSKTKTSIPFDVKSCQPILYKAEELLSPPKYLKMRKSCQLGVTKAVEVTGAISPSQYSNTRTGQENDEIHGVGISLTSRLCYSTIPQRMRQQRAMMKTGRTPSPRLHRIRNPLFSSKSCHICNCDITWQSCGSSGDIVETAPHPTLAPHAHSRSQRIMRSRGEF